MGRNTLLPIFEEAAKKHKKNLYFINYFDLFYLAKSKIQFEKLMQKAVKKELTVIEKKTNKKFGDLKNP